MGNSKSKVAPHKEFYKPTGMYPKIEWDQKTIRTRIKKKQLAPIYPLQTNKMDSYIEECPICFYRFPSINRTKCCDKPICTECFLQITPKYPTNENKCPFCQAKEEETQKKEQENVKNLNENPNENPNENESRVTVPGPFDEMLRLAIQQSLDDTSLTFDQDFQTALALSYQENY
ncbi:protein sip5 [Anaeramoeba ignava]|uniref:Protein sip5 n=1 Tax=Anaeramoeba ignava TaxID=1746090 RepID=A0A9Q0LMQ1_ANAIG|nr:protein sip5 [Anaeramoeba ignava]